ncbi:SAM-dependent methyltransferase [Tsukamurella sp. 8F]|uniref:class I SAM-dependent methyltransferase n=1 Tax=unclassified Tsukamurella TaxID=2633480 RepID=UPI0023BA0779|nr:MULTISPECIES: SAM-dependent methyltransferase [unclassified Tsukamurella]MDF0530565.1 SAM-dependent methyltransferase [Tsukamurella sp. 8J]MDF0586785.1 SAM-dependent methyltransferase [Tsukamurella sp. 8F]
MVTEPIRHVSDTARWVAALRAEETARPDALFRDPLAHRLAGVRGADIARRGRAQQAAGDDAFFVVTRTALLDNAVAAALRGGCDAVVNLGAGLDTRPYRLDLPRHLDWYEADDAGLLEGKARLLDDEIPRCRLYRRALDVTDESAVRALLDELSGRRIAVLTEGLLMYLDPDAVDRLTLLLHRSDVATWSFDLSTAGVASVVRERNAGLLKASPWRFLPATGVAFFEQRGWQVDDVYSIFVEAVRLGRLDGPGVREAAAGPQPDPRAPGDVPYSAVVSVSPVHAAM